MIPVPAPRLLADRDQPRYSHSLDPSPPPHTDVKRLEIEDALPAPLYGVAAVLVLVPAIDFLQSVGGFQPGSGQWRFATVGALSSYLATPVLGAAVALVVAAIARHHGVRRGVAVGCLVLSGGLALLSAGFALDALQLRDSVVPGARGAFQGASVRALLKLLIVAAALAFLGWRAWRIAPERPGGPRKTSVPLVSRAGLHPRPSGTSESASRKGQGDARTEREPSRP